MLPPLPTEFAVTRDALHQIAFFVLGRLRYQAVGRMGLRPTPSGFGTPEFEGRVARVEGDLLVYEQEGNIATRTITTVREAAEFVGLDYQVVWFEDFHDPLEPVDTDLRLPVDFESAHVLGRWFAFGFDVLQRLRSQTAAEEAASEPQLWPEHFDAAVEMGNEVEDRRATYGASPGDRAHPTPYLYVSAWGDIDRSDLYWNDDSFNGSSLPYDQLLETSDPAGRALEFLLAGVDALGADG
ncbi:MAG: hypothetical protein ACRDVL_13405 [Acidimicrobiia bacterium]